MRSRSVTGRRTDIAVVDGFRFEKRTCSALLQSIYSLESSSPRTAALTLPSGILESIEGAARCLPNAPILRWAAYDTWNAERKEDVSKIPTLRVKAA